MLKKLGLIGNPIKHSKSPLLFKAAYNNSEFVYDLVEAESANDALKRVINEEYIGVNVTSPFKDDVMKFVTKPDRVSSLLKSANILIREGADIYSYNSDYYGVFNTIEDYIKSEGAIKITSALVIGAGGAGKAATLALKDMGLEVYLANRSVDKAAAFVNDINSCSIQSNESTVNNIAIENKIDKNAKAIDLNSINDIIAKCQLIVYTLAFKIPHIDETKWCGKVIFEANYANAQFCGATENSTTKTKKLSYTYLNGKYWLYNQAIPAFKLFTHQEPNSKAMWEIL